MMSNYKIKQNLILIDTTTLHEKVIYYAVQIIIISELCYEKVYNLLYQLNSVTENLSV